MNSNFLNWARGFSSYENSIFNCISHLEIVQYSCNFSHIYTMKILMVCLGNICRSPLAEGLLRFHLQKSGLSQVIVDSAGTSGWHNGAHPDQRSIKNSKQNGVDISQLVSRKFVAADFEVFDKIYVMDQSNLHDVLKLSPSNIHSTKVEMLLNISVPESNKAVPDPYFGGENGFQEVFDLVNEACEAIVKQIQTELK